MQSTGNLTGFNRSIQQREDEGMDIRVLDEDLKKMVYGIKSVQSMIEVKIVYNEEYSLTKITNVAEGNSPEWNEILEFPLKALNERKFTK